MPPEEQSSSPSPHGRQPFPRRTRMSMDGMIMPNRRGASIARQPMPSNRPGAPVAPAQPTTVPVAPAAVPSPSVRPQRPAGYMDVRPGRSIRPVQPAQPMPQVSQQVQADPDDWPGDIDMENDSFSKPVVVAAPAPVISAAAQPEPAPVAAESSSPPKKRLKLRPPNPFRGRLKLLIILLIVLVVLGGLAGGAVWYFKAQAKKNNPATVFQDALNSSLSTAQLQSNTVGPAGGSQTNYDFSKLTNPLVSGTATINLYGAQFQIEGYGSARNTFISYAKFPSFIDKTVTTAAQSAWVQLRTNGVVEPNISAALTNLADPRFQNFGPLVFGDFPLADRMRQINFLLSQHVYAFNTAKVTKTVLGGAKVFVFPVTLNIGYLKIFIQSAASTEGFNPDDVQAAVNNLDNYKNVQVSLYVSASTHRFVQAVYNEGNQIATVNYSAYNAATLLPEPETNVTWEDFAPLQLRIEQESAAQQPVGALDAQRQSDLKQIHTNLATYFAEHGFYPTYPQLDNLTWVAANMPGMDPDIFRDPLGGNTGLAAAPVAKSYSYQTTTAAGKSCDNNLAAASPQICTLYALTATLSDGQKYVIPQE